MMPDAQRREPDATPTGSQLALTALLDLLLPDICLFCRNPGPFVPHYPGICRFCLPGLPLRLVHEQELPWPDRPRQVASGLNPWCQQADERLLCAAWYRPPLDRALIRFKFSDAPDSAVSIASLMLPILKRLAGTYDGLVGVPLHPARRWERGYDQAELLCRQLAARSGLPDLSAGLSRVRATSRQSESTGRAMRLANLDGAFAADRTFWQAQLQHAAKGGPLHLLLIDDVMTTGATVLAAATPLRQLGFRVSALTAASDCRPLPKPTQPHLTPFRA